MSFTPFTFKKVGMNSLNLSPLFFIVPQLQQGYNNRSRKLRSSVALWSRGISTWTSFCTKNIENKVWKQTKIFFCKNCQNIRLILHTQERYVVLLHVHIDRVIFFSSCRTLSPILELYGILSKILYQAHAIIKSLT